MRLTHNLSCQFLCPGGGAMAVASSQVYAPAAALPTGHVKGAASCLEDSDDEYDYVASLAEQIARAMLEDDDDAQGVEERPVLPPIRLTNSGDERGGEFVQAAGHDIWSCAAKPRVPSQARYVPLYSSHLQCFGSEVSCTGERLSYPRSSSHIPTVASPKDQIESGFDSAVYDRQTLSCLTNGVDYAQACKSLQDWQYLAQQAFELRSTHLYLLNRKGSHSRTKRPDFGHGLVQQAVAAAGYGGAVTRRSSTGAAAATQAGTGVFLPRVYSASANHRRKNASLALHSRTGSSGERSSKGFSSP